jgi:hypothetical protein
MIFLIAREMIVVNLDNETGRGEYGSERFYAERSVDEKYCSVRRLRSG